MLQIKLSMVAFSKLSVREEEIREYIDLAKQ